MQSSLPEVDPARTVLNRLWPLLLSTLGAGALGFALPQVPAIACGFAIIWALGWRRQASAVTAIEERDGARFYVERTSPLRPIKLVRTPGFRTNLLELNGASSSHQAQPEPAGRRHAWRNGQDRGDVLVVSVGATTGWRAAARELADGLQRAGAAVRIANARAAQRCGRSCSPTSCRRGQRAMRAGARSPSASRSAIVYCSITAALLWPRPGAIWLDSLAAENRPGRHGIWQRVVERRRLAAATLVLTMADSSLDPIAGRAPARTRSSCPWPSVRPAHRRPRATSTHSPTRATRRSAGSTSSSTRGERARRDHETLVVAGIDRARSSGRGDASPAGWRPTSTARSCAGRGCTSPRRAARTSGSRRSRRSPTGACWSRRPPRAPTRRSVSRGRSTRAWSDTTSRGACERRSTIRSPITLSGRPSCWRRSAATRLMRPSPSASCHDCWSA